MMYAAYLFSLTLGFVIGANLIYSRYHRARIRDSRKKGLTP
jgi:hypothetical protein